MSKENFRSNRRELVNDNIKASLNGILVGIKHLYSLSLVHNDINPGNVMFDEDGTPILIDFDSYRQARELLLKIETKRTYHWHDPRVNIV